MRVDALIQRLGAAYRRTGADLPGGDPRPTHGAEMEGWFWRFTDRDRGRVVLALCGVNRHVDGDWATVAVAAHPGQIVRSAACDGASASDDVLDVDVPGVLHAHAASLHVDVAGARLDVELHDVVGWPHRLGAGGVFSAIPFLGQYWHPHILGGRASGTLEIDGETWVLDGADVYAEKNWGAGFPDEWWWGQAQGFDDPDLCVAFGGGRLRAGPVAIDVTGCVVRLGDEVVRFAPPLALVRSSVDDRVWRVTARRPGWRVEMEGDGSKAQPSVLPVPLPAERRNVDRDLEHLAGSLRLRVWRSGDLVVDDRSELAALEVGSTDPDRAAALAEEHGVGAARVG